MSEPAVAPRLSVVQIIGARRDRAREAIARLRAQKLRDPIELVWVDTDPDSGPLPVEGSGLQPRVVLAPGATFAEAGAKGASEARGEYVAMLEDHAFAKPEWAQGVIDAYDESKAAMVNYAFTDVQPHTYFSRAFLMAEYGRWMHPARPGPVSIPSCNNISYRRSVLERYAQEKPLAEWFRMEYLLHRRILSEGGVCWQATDAIAEHEDWYAFGDGLHANAVMKRLNAASVSGDWGLPKRLFYAAAMVVAPPLHLARLAGSVASRPALWGQFLVGLPVTIPLYVHMTFHEALGYLFGAGQAEEQFAEMELALKRR